MTELFQIDLWSSPEFLLAGRLLNLIISLFCAIFMFSMQTETSTENPWTKCLGIAFFIFFLQYLTGILGIPIWVEHNLLSENINSSFWQEFFGIPINFFLLLTTRMLLNKRKLVPGWFWLLVGIDILGTLLGWIVGWKEGILIENSVELIPTLCRISGDLITVVGIIYFAYASYINTKYSTYNTGIILGLLLGLLYSGIHCINPFIPNISLEVNALAAIPPETVARCMSTIFIFIAAPMKLLLFLQAFLILALENKTLIKLRKQLRKSVLKREVFFSRKGILKEISEIFKAPIKLYILIPSETRKEAHLYSSSKDSISEYEVVKIKDTPLRELREKLSQTQDTDSYFYKKSGDFRFLLNRIIREDTSLPNEFDGRVPILYHGGLIGCYVIETDSSQKLTYSAEQIFRILSEDISPLIEFYRVQESFRVFNEEFNNYLENYSDNVERESPSFSVENLSNEIKNIIQGVLSPLKTIFVIETGFVESHFSESVKSESTESTNGRKLVRGECRTGSGANQLNIGHFILEYEKDRDSLKKPSLGYFKAYRDAVSSLFARVVLASVEYRFNVLIRSLSFELAKKQTFDKWFDSINKCLTAAEIDGLVVLHPETQTFWQSEESDKNDNNRFLIETLTALYPEPKKILEKLNSTSFTEIPLGTEIKKKTSGIILGSKLSLEDLSHPDEPSESAIFINVKRSKFARELQIESPWSKFLSMIARIAGNSLSRIIFAKRLQREQTKQSESLAMVNTAGIINLLTHELINNIESLDSSIAQINREVVGIEIDESLKKPAKDRIISAREHLTSLMNLADMIRSSTDISDPHDHCLLRETVENAILYYERIAKADTKIKFERIISKGFSDKSFEIISDVKLRLSPIIVQQIFISLIRNSIAAIKRKSKTTDFNKQYVIRIWAEIEKGKKYINCFVNDNGEGISPEYQEKVFDLGFSTNGRGWGLSIAKNTLEINSGSVTLEYSEPGNTTFRIQFPMS